MKYTLSFCEIEQLTENIFEVTINNGATINEECAHEAEKFWQKLRQEPYKLLVNNKNQFSYSFLGAQKIGEHSLEQKTAILISDPIEEGQMENVRDLKKMSGKWENRNIFYDRKKALTWLKQT